MSPRSRGSSHRSWFRSAGHFCVCVRCFACLFWVMGHDCNFGVILPWQTACLDFLEGNVDYMSVASANRLARRVSYLCLVCTGWQHDFVNLEFWTNELNAEMLLVIGWGRCPKDSLSTKEKRSMGTGEPHLLTVMALQMYSRYLVANNAAGFHGSFHCCLMNTGFWNKNPFLSRRTKNLLRKYSAISVSVPLGAFGALTAKPVSLLHSCWLFGINLGGSVDIWFTRSHWWARLRGYLNFKGLWLQPDERNSVVSGHSWNLKLLGNTGTVLEGRDASSAYKYIYITKLNFLFTLDLACCKIAGFFNKLNWMQLDI